MNVANIERSFSSYLERCWAPDDQARFSLVYIRLLLLFRDHLSLRALSVVLERQKQLRGHPFDGSDFEAFRSFVRDELSRHLKIGDESTAEVVINRLLFCVLLDSDETDFFYFVEPIFEFVRVMGISAVELTGILESEFAEFRVG